MLSRIAESFFWMGRYLERAEATTRLLAEHYQLLVEDQSVEQDIACGVLLDALGLISDERSSREALVRAVVGTAGNPSTIAGAVSAARDNARSIRESLSSDTYEALNATNLLLSRGIKQASSPGVTLYQILERLLVVNGVVDWTMPRDEAHQFLVLGRELERIDMMSRLLSIRHDLLWPAAGPLGMLHATGSLSAFLRSGSTVNGDDVRAFLVLDAMFPRSMRTCAADAEAAVRALSAMGVSEGGALLSEVGMLRSALEFANPGDPRIVDTLIVTAQESSTRASAAVNQAFFRQHGTVVWSH